jgi:hypothetical protein
VSTIDISAWLVVITCVFSRPAPMVLIFKRNLVLVGNDPFSELVTRVLAVASTSLRLSFLARVCAWDDVSSTQS